MNNKTIIQILERYKSIKQQSFKEGYSINLNWSNVLIKNNSYNGIIIGFLLFLFVLIPFNIFSENGFPINEQTFVCLIFFGILLLLIFFYTLPILFAKYLKKDGFTSSYHSFIADLKNNNDDVFSIDWKSFNYDNGYIKVDDNLFMDEDLDIFIFLLKSKIEKLNMDNIKKADLLLSISDITTKNISQYNKLKEIHFYFKQIEFNMNVLKNENENISIV